MFLRYTFDSPVVRDEDHGFVRHYDVDIFGFGENDKHLIGRAAFDVFLWGDAEGVGADPLDICDADSQGWFDVFCALSGRERLDDGGRNEILPELGIEEFVDSVTFIWRFLIHPDARSSHTKAIVESIARYVGNDSILTAWHSTLGISDDDLVDIGFARVGGTPLVFRDLHLRTPYGERFPLGEEVNFDALPEHERWLLGQWEESRP